MKSTLKNYEYTKDDGSTSVRALYDMGKPPAPNVQALDLSELTIEERVRVAGLYDEWKAGPYKDYAAKEKAFRKENLVTFEKFLDGKHVSAVPVVKSWKIAGLREIVEG